MYSFKKSLIALAGLLALVAVFAALLPLVGRGQGQAGDKNPLNRDPRRSFYLTQTIHNGAQALSACAAGYHMASLWEIFDTSNLRYDTQLGATTADSGFGPPAESAGWIRTGGTATDANITGRANCNAWTSASNSGFGTIVGLSPNWESSPQEISPWSGTPIPCGGSVPVWCVQD